jgi:hypothetical protein
MSIKKFQQLRQAARCKVPAVQCRNTGPRFYFFAIEAGAESYGHTQIAYTENVFYALCSRDRRVKKTGDKPWM